MSRGEKYFSNHDVVIDKIRCFDSYTWKIYATKVLNMGSVYGFWRQLNKDEKQAKQRYIQLLYNLQFRNLVSWKGRSSK